MLAQLPSVQLDAVYEDTEPVVVANRNPQPGEVQIPLDVTIEFDYFGDGASLGDLVISVNDEEVGSNGVWHDGWNGTAFGLPSLDSFRFLMKPPQPFENNELVRIELRIGSSIEGYWEFRTYDVQPPLVSTVSAINKDHLRVVFSEPVQMGNSLALADGDALNPTSYGIEHISRPAVTPNVSRVDYVSATEVILTTEMELSFGAQYMLVVAGVADEFGNTFLPPNNICNFVGYLPPFADGRRWLLHDFVPRIALSVDDGTLRLFLGCLQDANNILLHSIDHWLEIIDPDTAPEDFVDAMLVDLGNPFEFPLTLAQKRRLAKVLVLIYQLKGTTAGIIAVVRFFLGIEVTIETFVDRGWIIGHHQISSTQQVAPNPAIIGPNQHALYCFRVLCDLILTDEQIAYIRTIAIYMKGAQEHLVGVRDGRPRPPRPYWWTVGITQTGYAHIFGGTGAPTPPVTPPNTPRITAFTLATP